MKEKMKTKTLSVALLALMLVTSCNSNTSSSGSGNSSTGGQQGSTSSSKNNNYADVTFPDFPSTPEGVDSWTTDNEETTITWYVNDASFTWSTYGDDRVSQLIKEKTGITINFISPVTDDGAMLSNMIAGNSLPDLISVQSWYQQCTQLAMQGYVYPMNDLIDKWAPSMKTRLQEDVFNWFSLGNDKTYGFPNFAYSSSYVDKDEKMQPNGGILVREDWYKEATAAIGSDMTSPSSFIEGCKYIKNKYDKSIPIQMDVFDTEGNDSVKWLSQYFSTPFEDENGNYIYNIEHENYQETLKFLNDCYQEKLIDDSNFSANASQIKTKIAQGNVFVSMVTPQDYSQGFISAYNSDIKYVPLVLRNSKGDDPILQDIRGMGYLFTMVPTKCKRPDKVIKLLDFLYSEEGQRLVAFGEENVTWKWKDETHTEVEWTDQYLTDSKNDNTAKYGLYQMTLLMNLAYINKIRPMNGRKEVDIYIDNLQKPLSPYSYDYTASFLKDDASVENYNDITTNENRATQRWAQYLPRIIRSKNNEGAMNEYQTAIDYLYKRYDLAKVKEFNAVGYKRALEALGISKAWPIHLDGYKSPVTGPNGDFSYWKGATHE